MYLEPMQRQMAVCSFEEAMRLTNIDKGYWNVVSIHGPHSLKAYLPLAKTVYYACFDDIENDENVTGRSATAEDVAGIFKFVRALGVGPPKPPVLIHCQQGISRSAAVALSWIYGELPPAPNRIKKALDLTLQLRPEARPNRLVLALGLACFVDAAEARSLAEWVVNEPRVTKNWFPV